MYTTIESDNETISSTFSNLSVGSSGTIKGLDDSDPDWSPETYSIVSDESDINYSPPENSSEDDEPLIKHVEPLMKHGEPLMKDEAPLNTNCE